MANKIKNHTPETLTVVKTISTALYAQFIASKIPIGTLSKKTGLSSNSLKTIFRGETANIASYIAVAHVLGLNLSLVTPAPAKADPVSNQTTGDGRPSATFLR